MNFHQISDAERELIDVMRALSPERRAAAKRAVTREYWRNLNQIRRKATCSVDPRNARR